MNTSVWSRSFVEGERYSQTRFSPFLAINSVSISLTHQSNDPHLDKIGAIVTKFQHREQCESSDSASWCNIHHLSSRDDSPNLRTPFTANENTEYDLKLLPRHTPHRHPRSPAPIPRGELIRSWDLRRTLSDSIPHLQSDETSSHLKIRHTLSSNEQAKLGLHQAPEVGNLWYPKEVGP